MSWECRHKSGDHCNRLDVECDPGRSGCVLHGRFYFPFAPEKNTKAMNEAARTNGRPGPRTSSGRRDAAPDRDGAAREASSGADEPRDDATTSDDE